MKDWWYVEKDKKNGPFKKDDIAKLIKSGKIGSTTLVWSEGMESWIRFDEISELQDLKQAVPPPIPKKVIKTEAEHSIASGWPRFFARLFDFWLVGSMITLSIVSAVFFMGLSVPNWVYNPIAKILFVLILSAILLTLDAAIYKVFGNTPGKALLGLNVVTLDFKPLTFGRYLYRNFSMWFRGLALGIPVITFVAMYYEFDNLRKGKPTSYDDSIGCRVRSKAIGLPRKIIFGVMFLSLCFFVLLLSPLTKHVVSNSPLNEEIKYSYWVNPVTNVSTKIDSSWLYTIESDGNGKQTYMFTEKSNRAFIILGVQSFPGATLEDYVESFKFSAIKNMSLPDRGVFSKELGKEIWQGTGRPVGDDGVGQYLDVQIVKVGDDFWRTVTVQGAFMYDDNSVKLLKTRLWSTVLSQGL